jgi:hypothetical protein
MENLPFLSTSLTGSMKEWRAECQSLAPPKAITYTQNDFSSASKWSS